MLIHVTSGRLALMETLNGELNGEFNDDDSMIGERIAFQRAAGYLRDAMQSRLY